MAFYHHGIGQLPRGSNNSCGLTLTAGGVAYTGPFAVCSGKLFSVPHTR